MTEPGDRPIQAGGSRADPRRLKEERRQAGERRQVSRRPEGAYADRDPEAHAEHADGDSEEVIIRYNCREFTCSGDLVEKLIRVAERYPRFVYLAPSDTMDARITRTREGRILVLEAYDPERMHGFINE